MPIDPRTGQPMPAQRPMPGGPPPGGPPPGGPPQAGPPQGQPQQLPPEIARHIDPNNPVQMTLLQRIDKLTPQDEAAVMQIPPPAIAVLKKIIPEVAFLLDMISPAGGGMPGGAPMGGAPAPMQPAPSRLSSI